ncbi:cysteine desulfurase family protein [Geomicrobium sp. JSM 1781026]|uniref:cysteine desulfurase family protein n=1 Tax=Geomicrobium sp. JSM 1781026 TaxID=3344580 RepID=UPI0035BF29F3
MNEIYFDHAATTPVRDEVFAEMKPYYDGTMIGNASSIHRFGRKVRVGIDEARRVVAGQLNSHRDEIIFTSGGTESNNLAIRGAVHTRKQTGKHIVTSQIEHHAVLHVLDQLEDEGFEVTRLPVDERGVVNAADVERALRPDTILVSIMHGNNETGMIQPIEAISSLLENHEALFHTDAVQSFGKMNFDVQALGVDLLTGSAHKVNGPKGAGFLYVKKGTNIQALIYGGEQEKKLRPGTENAAAIAGLKKAVQLLGQDGERNADHSRELKEKLVEELRNRDVPFEINGALTDSLPHIINISFPGSLTEPMLAQLDMAGIAVSSGSACTAGSFQPSHVLEAMYGSDDERVKNSLRFSFGYGNDEQQVIHSAKQLEQITRLIREKRTEV